MTAIEKALIEMDRSEETARNAIRNTVGYKESDDKFEFDKGADVAFRLFRKALIPLIKNQANTIERQEKSDKEARDDLRTLSDILFKHSAQNQF